MPRVQPKSLSFLEKRNLLDNLWNLIASLQNKEEIANFFRDLLSETEALMLARRIQIAKLLLEGRSYEQVGHKLNTSYVTIAKVHHWLQSGTGSHSKAISRLEKKLFLESRKNYSENQPAAFSFKWLKRKYPLHFLLFNLLDQKNNRKRKDIQ